MSPLSLVLVSVILVAAPASPAEEPPPGGAPAAALPAVGESVAALCAKVDELWKRRDEGQALAAQKSLLDQALARAGSDYQVLWRAARWHFWRSDDPDLPMPERMRLGKKGWELGDRAIASNPGHVAGHFWAAASMGNYALGLGVVRALTQGIEGKFKERLTRAEALDAGYAHASVQVAWGRYFSKLPWPKYDQKKARAYFAQAFQGNPHNLRARVFLAELLAEEDEPVEARRLVEEVLRASPGKYDAPEERRAKLLAARFKARLDRGD